MLNRTPNQLAYAEESKNELGDVNLTPQEHE